MISDCQKRQLEKIKEQNYKKTVADNVNMTRLQRRIDHMLINSLWLAENFPEIFLGKGDRYKPTRLRQLLMIIKTLNPKMDVQLVLANLPERGLKSEQNGL
jgi:hypothetical protein